MPVLNACASRFAVLQALPPRRVPPFQGASALPEPYYRSEGKTDIYMGCNRQSACVRMLTSRFTQVTFGSLNQNATRSGLGLYLLARIY